MWFKAAVLGGSGIILPNLAVWTMAGLGITLAFHSSREWVDYCNRLLNVVAREENDSGIDREDDNGIDLESDNRIDRENDNGVDRENGNGIDRESDNGIDRLPDDILCNIVSRLRSIEASRTSILSRRWRNIWTMNPSLKLCCLLTLDEEYHDDVAFDDRQRFLKAVNQCLQLYSGRKLKIFFLYCCFLDDHTGHLVQWMQTLARLDVEELFLGHSCETCPGDPVDKLFTFSFKLIDGLSRLKYISLTSCDVETSFVSQCYSLVKLYLRLIPLRGHKLSDILMSCPNLTSLYMERCELPQNLRISGSSLKLESLTLVVCYNVQTIEISDFNVMTLLIDIRSKVEVLLSSLPKLGRLHLRTHGINYRFGYVQRDLPQLKRLFLRAHQILQLPPTFQVFRNIKELFLMTRGYPYPEACEVVDLWNFAPVLSACPLLEEFYLVIGEPVCKEERKARRWPVLVHEHLQLMELSGFSNTQNELEFAKFILTSAQVLKCLRLLVSPREFNGQVFYHEVSKQIDAQVAEAVCATLQGHALSMRAQVKVV